jgi:hypothetical protein
MDSWWVARGVVPNKSSQNYWMVNLHLKIPWGFKFCAGESCSDVWLEESKYLKRDKDCIMLTKQLVSSTCLSQPPLVVLPSDYLPRLQKPLGAMPRSVLSDRARKEFLATYSSTCKLCYVVVLTCRGYKMYFWIR